LLVRELSGVGLWIEGSALSAEDTVRLILGAPERARLSRGRR
jgi:hypothetical protein